MPSVAAYFEPRYNVTKDLQLYIGTSGESISFANRAAAEIDVYGGIRPTFGALPSISVSGVISIRAEPVSSALPPATLRVIRWRGQCASIFLRMATS